MKQLLKRALCLTLASLMMVCAAGCGNETTKKKSGEKAEPVTFPLKEPVTYNFMIAGTKSTGFDQKIANNKVFKKLEEETNVHINFTFLGDDTTKLSLLISSGEYGDVIWGGPILNSVEASKYMAAGVLTDITDYVAPEIMPELCSDIEENPSIKKMITASDGRIYTIPKITGLEGNYIESPIWINKKWLDKVGMPIPKTLDEFTACLRAFRDKDPNGNGLPDEIPYICTTSHSYMHTEALLGCFGIATKDGANDAFVQVKNGKVTFAPTTPAYKDAIKFMAGLYKEGLMWSECFTANNSTLNSKLGSDTCLVGCFTSTGPITSSYMNDYVCIAPPKADKYDTCWYYHPAINGSKNQFFVTDHCKNISALMAWVDHFYNLEYAIGYEYGTPEDGRVEIDSNGKYTFKELSSAEASKKNKEFPTLYSLMGNATRSITSKDFAEKINLSKDYQTLQNTYSIYKDILNKELWPRPYYAAEDSYEAADYVVDINTQVATYRAQWITGKSNIDKDWDGFVKSFDSLGLKEYLNIMQKAYDIYCES